MRIFLTGPPGCRKKEKALTLAEEFNFVAMSVGDLLDREVSKKSESGKKIADAKAKFSYGIKVNTLISNSGRRSCDRVGKPTNQGV